MIDTVAGGLRKTFLVALPVLGVLWLIDAPYQLGLSIVTASYLAFFAGLATAASLLAERPGSRGRGLDLLLAFVALACWTWGAWHIEDWLISFTRGPEKWVPGALALILLLEAVRRTCGLAITLVVVATAAYGFLGYLLPGTFEAAYTSPARLILYFYADTNGVPGLVLGVASTIVLAFIILGAVMGQVGASEFFTDLAMSTMGHRRGGPAKVAVLASSLFGTISGSTVANVMTIGVVTIPLMKKAGFPSHLAAGIEAVSSNGGQLAPPVMGATAFLIAQFLHVPYSDVVAAAIMPAFVYYLVLFAQIDLIAKRLDLKGLPRAELPRLSDVLRTRGIYATPLILLVYLLFWKGEDPAKAGLYTTVLTLLVGCFAQRLLPTPRFLLQILLKAGESLVPLLLICAAAGIVIGSLNITGLGFLLTNLISHVGANLGLLAMLVLTALIAIFLGMGMPTAAVYIVLSIILAPALVHMGVAPMAANLFIFYFGLVSMLTPPVAIASYAAGGLAGAGLWETGLAGLRLGASSFVLPFLFCFNPALVAQGSALEIFIVFVDVLAAGYLLSIAMSLLEVRGIRESAIQLLLLGFAAIFVGSATLWLGRANPVALVPALAIPVLPMCWRRVKRYRAGSPA